MEIQGQELRDAVWLGNMKGIITLLESKERRWALLAERSPDTNKQTPLHIAAEAGQVGAVQALLHAADEDEGEGPMSLILLWCVYTLGLLCNG